jgi:hypothetical protein
MQSNSHIKYLVGTAFAIAIMLWLGIPMYRQWQADKLVDQLCAKDGGTTVYEIVKLSTGEYSRNWIINLPSESNRKLVEKYYKSSNAADIVGSSSSELPNEIVIMRAETEIIRFADKKVMAKLVSYSRRGGDPISPFHPSHYSCPKNGFSSAVFVIN